MKRIFIIAIIAMFVTAPCYAAIKWKFIHAHYLIIGNGSPPPPAGSADIGGFGGDTIGGFGGENIGGLP